MGTSIELWLPFANSPLPTPVAATRLEPGTGSGQVLLVDDEELVRGSTAEMLAELGYDVIECASAEAALKLIDEGLKPDVVVSDHLLPGMTGSDLARTLQSRGFDSTLIISGYARDEGISPDLLRLTKPFRQEELSAALQQVAARKISVQVS